jgi:hypothetical protein
MKTLLSRLSLAAALTLAVAAMNTAANAQEPSSQEPAATAPTQQDQNQPTSTPQQDSTQPSATPQQNESQMPAAGADAQTQDAKSFSGRIMKEDGKVVLKDPVTKNSYQIADPSKVKQYMGKQVKVTGKLDMNSNTIQVDSIGPLS